MGAEDILSEFAEIGLFEDVLPPEKKVAPAPDVAPSTPKDSVVPPSSVRDARVPRMLAFFDRAIDLLETSIKAQVELHELFEEIRAMWVPEEVHEPVEEDDESDEVGGLAPPHLEETDSLSADDSEVDVEVTVSEEDIPATDLLETEDNGPISEPVPIRTETSNSILDFYAENDAAGVTLGVEEEPSEPVTTSDAGEAFAQGRAKFLESLKVDAERGMTR